MTEHTRLADAPGAGAGDGRPEPLLPPALVTGWLRLRHGWRVVDSAALALALAHLGMLAWVALPGGFYLDDFRAQTAAAASDLGVDYLLRTPDSHLAPVPRLIIWWQTELAPLDRVAAVGAMLVLSAVLAALVWLLLRELFGAHRRTLVPYLVFCASPFLVPMFGWWAQAVTLSPAHVAVVTTMLLHCRYLRTERRRDAVGALTAYAIGLLCWEKALLALPLVGLLTVLFLAPGQGWRERVRSTWHHRGLAAAYTAVTLAYLAAYLGGGYDRGAPGTRVGVADALDAYTVNLTRSLIPGMAGGPWRWDAENSPYFGIAAPGPALTALAVVLVATVTVLAARRDPSRVARAWAVLLVPWLIGFGMVIVGRVSKFGILPAVDYRYVAEFGFLVPLALGLATLPLVGGAAGAGPRALRSPADPALRRAAPVLLGAYLIGATVSVTGWASAWHDNPTAQTVPAMRESFLAAGSPVHVYDVPVAPALVPAFFAPYNRLPLLLAPLDDGRMQVGSGNTGGSVLAADGRLVPARLATVTAGVRGPSPDCGWALNSTTPGATVRLDRRVPALDGLVVRLSMLVGADSSVEVVARSPEGPRVITPADGAAVRSGPDAVVLPLPPVPLTALEVTLLDTRSGLCLDTVTVARPLPVEDP